MINELNIASKFASKDKNSVFSNIFVKDGMIQSCDGLSGVTFEVQTELNFCCNAQKLATIISQCDPAKIKLKLNKNKLEITSGKIRSKIDLTPIENYPVFMGPTGGYSDADTIMDDVSMIAPFAAPDDVRIFMQGVIVKSGSIEATNGHTVVIKDTDIEVKNDLIIPVKSIAKFKASKIPVNGFAASESAAYFKFAENNGHFFTRIIDSKTPNMTRMIKPLVNEFSLSKIADDLSVIGTVCDDTRTVIIGNDIKTRDESTVISDAGLPDCVFNIDYLLTIAKVADVIDFSQYPEPCPFEAEGLRGAIAGIRF